MLGILTGNLPIATLESAAHVLVPDTTEHFLATITDTRIQICDDVIREHTHLIFRAQSGEASWEV